jgi:hypothetical protein
MINVNNKIRLYLGMQFSVKLRKQLRKQFCIEYYDFPQLENQIQQELFSQIETQILKKKLN